MWNEMFALIILADAQMRMISLSDYWLAKF